MTALENPATELQLHEVIMFLKDNLKQEWKDVGRHLGLSESDINHIDFDYVGNTKEKCYQMLKRWEEWKGNAATISILVDALKDSGRNDISDLLMTGKVPDTFSPKRGIKKCSVTKETRKRDPRLQKLFDTLEPVIRYILVAAVAYLTCLVRGNMDKCATNSTQGENGTCPNVAPRTVQRLVDGTLALMDGIGKIEAQWKKFSAGSGRHTLDMGKPADGDKLLYEEKVRKGYCCYLLPIFRQSHIFKYDCKENEIMTAVKVEDGWDDGTGGNPEVVDGGPGICRVEIRVTSRIGRGMDFSFYVFGREDKQLL